MPRRSDISARYILKHCTAACLKTEIEGLDNQIFDINAHEKLPSKRIGPKRTGEPADIETTIGIDVVAESAAVSDSRAVATS